MSNYYIGVDGGGTKTEFIMADSNGNIVADIIKEKSHYLMIGFDGLEKVIQEGVHSCIERVGCQCSDIAFCAVCICGYGDVKAHDCLIEEAIDHALVDIPHQVYSDTFNAHRGSLVGKSGIHVIAGTGSIAFGINDEGYSARCGGWNHLFGGDEGSAYWLACKMLLHFTRQSDGRDKKTALYYDLKSKYHFNEDGDLIDYTVINLGFDRTKIANMAKDLYELAQKNDPVAIQIYSEAAQELYDMVYAISNQLDFDFPVLVSYSGGVFKSGKFVLEPFEEKLNATGFKLVKPNFNPGIGSLIVAYTQSKTELTDEMINQLRKYQ